MNVFLSLLLFLTLQIPQVVLAKCKTGTGTGCFQPKITWDIKRNQIINVCKNYGYGDWKYRSCRMEAQVLFKNRCAESKQKLKSSQGKYRDKNRAMVQRYCIGFRP